MTGDYHDLAAGSAVAGSAARQPCRRYARLELAGRNGALTSCRVRMRHGSQQTGQCPHSGGGECQFGHTAKVSGEPLYATPLVLLRFARGTDSAGK